MTTSVALSGFRKRFTILISSHLPLKCSKYLAATIIDDLFTTYHTCNLRSKSKFVAPSVRTVHSGQNSVQYYGPLIWNMIPGHIHVFLYKKNFYKKMSLKNPKNLRKCEENLQPQIPELQFLKTLIFLRAL